MKLTDKINGDQALLDKFSTLTYFMNKEIARNGFTDYIEEVCDMNMEEWKILKEWLNENGLKTYN